MHIEVWMVIDSILINYLARADRPVAKGIGVDA
jgi:hypothetical protein